MVVVVVAVVFVGCGDLRSSLREDWEVLPAPPLSPLTWLLGTFPPLAALLPTVLCSEAPVPRRLQ